MPYFVAAVQLIEECWLDRHRNEGALQYFRFTFRSAFVALVVVLLGYSAGAIAQPHEVKTSFSKAGSMLKPLEMWVKDGAVVMHGDFRARTAQDRAIDYPQQHAAIRRWVNLLVLATSPDLVDRAGALEFLAADNLGREEHSRMLKLCAFGQARNLANCRWKASNEFERARMEKEFTQRHLPDLLALAQQLPREMILVENALLTRYDPSTKGFPVSVSDFDKTVLRGESLFGKNTRIEMADLRTTSLTFFPMDEASAEALLERMDGRHVALATRYKIEDIRQPQNGSKYEFREFVLSKITSAVFADAALSDLVRDLSEPPPPLGDTSREQAANSSWPEIVEKPVEPAMYQGLPVLISDTVNIPADTYRFTYLLAVGQDNEIARNEKIARVLAEAFFEGLTRESGMRGWLGETEFERSRSQEHFMAQGSLQLIAMAERFGSDFMLVQKASLKTYDADLEMFPLELTGRWQPGSKGPMPLLWGNTTLPLRGAIWLEKNGMPLGWRVPENEAEAEFVRYRNMAQGLGVRDGRVVYVASRMRATGMRDGNLVATLLASHLFVDSDLTAFIADLPVSPAH